ncbi:MAG: UDP-N-acetylmuramoyl-L-alanyl-D-glutamate--2,6-diaminopimelate ligase [Actinomycetota bacterium]|nr:UDP-N-acetylmuramoyl-L-alanyl-D-glutamate--2,6-diaminopimelate ligase [Actinomycetota bacterium]
MRLLRLLGDLRVRAVRGDPGATDVIAVTHDSGAVVPGCLFCCVRGRRVDGHDFAAQAVAGGAVAVLCERPVDVGPGIPQIEVDAVRPAMALVAAALFDHPSDRMAVVGVTGTNGKTTTTHLLRAVLEADGRRAAVIGTLSGSRAAGHPGRPGGPGTTPEAPDLQAHLAELAGEGFEAVAMEVSSHALDQHRVDGTHFAVAVFTNLSQDHLDFHGSMERYFEAKAALFDADRAAVAVVNGDDPWGRRLLESPRLPTTPFSLADAVGLDMDRRGSHFEWEGHRVRLQIPGQANVANAVAAGAAARELAVGPDAVAAGLSSLVSVPGRNEQVDRGQPFTVLVDYAHTPDGLGQALTSARRLVGGGRVLVVFGCGGDRDRSKRPLMGEVATRLADLAVLTSDNPRSEDPLAIIEEARAGVQRPEVLVVEPDRRAAIALALAAAQTDDVVIIAGKGHESTQVVGTEVLPFDDRSVAAELLGAMDWGSTGGGSGGASVPSGRTTWSPS